MSNIIVHNLRAAADFLGTGAIETPIYDREIVDIVRRKSVFLDRIKSERGTGHPTRYFEQLAVATATDTDPRNLTPTVSGPNRVERSAPIKAFIAQENISLFDHDVTAQQGTYSGLEEKDIGDMVSAITRTQAKQAWSGTDTSLLVSSTTQYVGLLTQIGLQSTIAPGASIIDGLKAEVAAMVADPDFDVEPTAIYLSPLLGNYIDQEAKAAKIELKEAVVAGVKVNAIATQAGDLPLVSEQFIPTDTAGKYGFGNPPAGNKNYYAVILSEGMVERRYISGEQDNPNPRVFQLGLVSDLARKFVCVKFDTIYAVGPGYAHATVCVQRP